MEAVKVEVDGNDVVSVVELESAVAIVVSIDDDDDDDVPVLAAVEVENILGVVTIS